MSGYFNKLIKKNGKLEHFIPSNKKLYDNYINSLPEGTTLEFFIDIQENNGTLAQLAKIHAMIKELANHTGYTFEEMKLYVKKEAGMCYTSSNTLICKSFGESSKEDLSLVIQSIQEIALKVNYQI